MLRIERELEEARGRLTAIRQAKYKNRGDSDPDTDADQSGYEGQKYETRGYDTHNNSSVSPSQTMNQALGNLQGASQHINQIINDRENLVSPEKVYSTQSTLERKMKEGQFR